MVLYATFDIVIYELMHKKALTLSIVIPVYNEQHHLKACLDSIASQTEAPDQVIVVDNNSTDKSLAVAKKYPFVKIVQEIQQGVVFARDKGFNTNTSDIIGRIDSDTRLEPNWVETVKSIFTEEPELSAITGPVAYYDMPLVAVGQKIDSMSRTLVDTVQTTDFLFGTNMAVRSAAWEDVKDRVCHQNTIHEDLDLAIHLSKSGYKIAYKKQMLAGASTRRLDADPKSYHKYLKMNIETYRAHGIETITPRMASSLFWLAYITLKPIRLAYDGDAHKLSFRHMLKKKNPRVSPSWDGTDDA